MEKIIKTKEKFNAVLPTNTVVENKEPILKNNPNRFFLFPIQHNDIWQFYKTQQKSIWTTQEIDLSEDSIDWETKLNDNEQYFIKHVLAFLAESNSIVHKNLAAHFLNEVQYTEAKFFYRFQVMVESVHSETYSLLMDAYSKETKEKNYLHSAIKTLAPVRKKTNWTSRWIDNGSFAERLVAFAAVEGIFCSGFFCSIFWLKKKRVMPGLTSANELIFKDKGIQMDFACLLYNNHLVNKLPKEKVTQIITDAVKIEAELVTASISVRLIGMNIDLMNQYIEFVADKLLVQLGYDKAYNTKNPFDFMEMFSLQGKTTLFENRTPKNKTSSVYNRAQYSNKAFSLDQSF